MFPTNFADVVKIKDRYYRKEQIILYEFDGKVNFIGNKFGQIIEVQETMETKTLEVRTRRLDEIFMIVRSSNSEVNRKEELICSMCSELRINGHFITKIDDNPKYNLEAVVESDDIGLPLVIELEEKEENKIIYVCNKCWLSKNDEREE